MSSCPRCGTSLPVPAAICTACCQPLTDPGPEATPGWIDLTTLEAIDVSEPQPEPPRPSVDHHQRLASAGVGNGLGLTTNRSAGFNPLRISNSPPPPNRFRAAEQRQKDKLLGAAPDQDRPPIPGIQPTTKWVEPSDD